jgi:osmotically-inducible protein OsmY
MPVLPAHNVEVVKEQAKDLAERVSGSLARNGALEADHVKVTDLDGAVTLSGTVHSGGEKQEAERAAWRTDGVVSVKNKLVVRT